MADDKKTETNLEELYGEDYDTALKFTNRIYPEFSGVIKSIIYFGSSALKKEHRGDIDILIVFNDAEIVSDDNFRIYFQKQINDAILKTNERIHINSVTLTVFWENVLNGEPVVFNILRDGVPLIDTGFFSPLKLLLLKGKLKPSAEAILNMASRVSAHIDRSTINLLSAVQELYLSILDSSQSTIMAYGIVAPNPEKVPEMLKSIKFSPKVINIFKDLYKIFKRIEHRELTKMSGKDFESLKKRALEFNNAMEQKLKKKI